MKVALLQHSYKAKAKDYIRNQILGAKADLVCLQELHDHFYFCQRVNEEFLDLACSFDSDVEFYSNLARESKSVIVASLFEQRAVGLYHNTAVVLESDGSVAGKYRKMHIPDDPNFYEKFYFTQGDLGFEPIDTSLGRLGVLVCWDQWFPEAARIMALKGAEILIYPTAIGTLSDEGASELACYKDAWMISQRAHAIANGIPVISINRVGFERESIDSKKGITFWGNSFVCDSMGAILINAGESEGIVTLELDLKKQAQVRKIWPFFRDRRVDFYDDLLKAYLAR